MKKLILILAILISGMLINLKAELYGKNSYAGINPFGLVFGIYSGEVGHFLSQEAEINIPFYFVNWSSANITSFGLGGKYRMYHDKNGEGIFYGGGLEFSFSSWEGWKYDESGIYHGPKDDVSYMVITPLAEAGYRWTWENGWTIAPSLELGYSISTFDGDGYHNVRSESESRFAWSLNLGVAYCFNLDI